MFMIDPKPCNKPFELRCVLEHVCLHFVYSSNTGLKEEDNDKKSS